MTAHDLGLARGGAGDTRGAELIGNWRVTLGDAVLPADRPGTSRAGVEHVRRRGPRGRGGGGGNGAAWEYARAGVVPGDETFVVDMSSAHVEVRQNGRVLFRANRRHGEPAMLAFKNMWLSVQYRPRGRGGEACAGAAAAGAVQCRPRGMVMDESATAMAKIEAMRIEMSGS